MSVLRKIDGVIFSFNNTCLTAFTRVMNFTPIFLTDRIPFPGEIQSMFSSPSISSKNETKPSNHKTLRQLWWWSSDYSSLRSLAKCPFHEHSHLSIYRRLLVSVILEDSELKLTPSFFGYKLNNPTVNLVFYYTVENKTDMAYSSDSKLLLRRASTYEEIHKRISEAIQEANFSGFRTSLAGISSLLWLLFISTIWSKY